MRPGQRHSARVKFIERIAVVDAAGGRREIKVWEDDSAGSRRHELEDGSYVRQIADGVWEDLVRQRYKRA